MIYGPHHLWALRVECPALMHHVKPLRWTFSDAPGLPTEPKFCAWEKREGLPFAVGVPRFKRHTAYLEVPRGSGSPASARQFIEEKGIYLYAAMLEDGLRQEGIPLEAFVLVLSVQRPETTDHGMYCLGDKLMERGRVEYGRAVRDLEQAIRDGFPGWEAAGVQVIEDA